MRWYVMIAVFFVSVATAGFAQEEDLAMVRRAAEDGYAPAQMRLAWAYESGEGVATDAGAYRQWMQRAAEQGNPAAEYLMGNACTTVNFDGDHARTAHYWYRRAARHGDADAQCAMGEAFLHGEGIRCDPAAAARWFRRAADQGHNSSMIELGHCYRDGSGVPQSWNEAYFWLALASSAAVCAQDLRTAAGHLTESDRAAVDARCREWQRCQAARNVAAVAGRDEDSETVLRHRGFRVEPHEIAAAVSAHGAKELLWIWERLRVVPLREFRRDLLTREIGASVEEIDVNGDGHSDAVVAISDGGLGHQYLVFVRDRGWRCIGHVELMYQQDSPEIRAAHVPGAGHFLVLHTHCHPGLGMDFAGDSWFHIDGDRMHRSLDVDAEGASMVDPGHGGTPFGVRYASTFAGTGSARLAYCINTEYFIAGDDNGDGTHVLASETRRGVFQWCRRRHVFVYDAGLSSTPLDVFQQPMDNNMGPFIKRCYVGIRHEILSGNPTRLLQIRRWLAGLADDCREKTRLLALLDGNPRAPSEPR